MSGATRTIPPVYVSSIGYHHGERRKLLELTRTVPLDESLYAEGLAAYRVSGAEIWELGGGGSRAHPRRYRYASRHPAICQ